MRGRTASESETADQSADASSSPSPSSTSSLLSGPAWVAGTTMRSNLYMGTRTKTPNPVMFGVGWYGGSWHEAMRYAASDGDDLQQWGWEEHDGARYGRQVLGDGNNGVTITTQYLQVLPSAAGSDASDGSDRDTDSSGRAAAAKAAVTSDGDPESAYWVVRVTGEPMPDGAVEPGSPITLLLSLSNANGTLAVAERPNKKNPVKAARFIVRGDAKAGGEGDGEGGKRADAGDFIMAARVSAGDAPSPRQTVTADTDTSIFAAARRMLASRADFASDGSAGLWRYMMQHKAADDLWSVADDVKQALKHSRQEAMSKLAEHVVGPHAISRGVHPQQVMREAGVRAVLGTLPAKNFIKLDKGAPLPNQLVVQKTLVPPFTLDVVMMPPSGRGRGTDAERNVAAPGRAEKLLDTLTPDELSRRFDAASAAWNDRFEGTFRLHEHGVSDDDAAVARAALSNLLGGVTYFHGDWRLKNDSAPDGYDTVGPATLVTGVPSRSFFPRGFLWDEGFHQLLVSKWDPELSREVLGSWLGMMHGDDDIDGDGGSDSADGWIPREQILGPEARDRVPDEFEAQSPDVANPPTLLLAVRALVQAYADGVDEGAAGEVAVGADGGVSREGGAGAHGPTWEFARAHYGHLKRYLRWFEREQRAGGGDGGGSDDVRFFWRGTTREHCLASGLDDYPRMSKEAMDHDVEPTPLGDAHVDLLSWVAFAAQLLRDIAAMLGHDDDAAAFGATAQRYVDALEAHWSDDAGLYCDIGATAVDEETNTGTAFGHVCHAGYVSMFPLLLQLLPAESPHLPVLLDTVRERLLCDYGLRSLSESDPLFMKGEQYWRGKVWINLNFLALKALRHYAGDGGGEGDGSGVRAKAAALHDDVRAGVVRLVTRSYREQGFLYENYRVETRKQAKKRSRSSGGATSSEVQAVGEGTHPFTGWTSLIVLILAEMY